MDPQKYLLFVTASIILCVVPGPDMILLLSRTIAQGRKAGLMTAIGMNVGAYGHLTATLLGISAVIAASAHAFTVIKWLGAAYLIYLGVQILRSPSGPLEPAAEAPARQPLRRFWQGFWSDILNPKVALFFLAFLPQFVDVQAGSPLKQLVLLGLTVNIIGIITSIVLIIFAAAVTRRLRRRSRISTWMNKSLGGIFIILGLRLAAQKAL
ncbi:MAG TPA: LysE family translocator [Rhodocyclaceae bacterium]|nr:LysE family translocator [Rhodocyclaceae bacterium]